MNIIKEGEDMPKQIDICPACGGSFKLIKEDHWFYKCDGCKESFTTTESDTMSLEL